MVRWLIVFALSWLAVGRARGQEADYARDVKPLLRARCYACHGALKQQAGLRVDTVESLRRGGDSGPAIVVGDLEASPLWARISASDDTERMPPEGQPLSADQLAGVRRWLAAGATAAVGEEPEADPRSHWAFQVPQRPAVPQAGEGFPARNPIDAFLATAQAAGGVVPLPAADRHVLLRRVYLDLIGLPPSRAELAGFLADDRQDAYERVVDRLLASPQYGERWARHWMDVWRYSDWYGRRAVPDVLNSYAQIWRWRDWIVRSLNEDKGYDRMVLEMLAADELAAADDDNLVATGFLVRNFYRWNYNTWMKDNVEHVGKSLLGLTLNCAQCHDHKYDPLPQEEYFRFRAFFEPLELRHDRVPGEPDPGPFPKYSYGASYGPITSGMVRIVDEKLNAETFIYARGEERAIIPGRPPVSPGAPAIVGGGDLDIVPIELPAVAWYPGMKAFVRDEERAARQAAIVAARQELEHARAALSASEPQWSRAVDEAEAAWSADATGGSSPSNTDALSGELSLVLDAAQGRRTLAHPLAGLVQINEFTSLTLQLRIRQDGHVNLQLARDLSRGLTAAYVSFRGGRIETYRPGTFEVCEVGRYNAATGPRHFDVRLDLDPAQDRLLLSVTQHDDGQLLVDRAAAALNGWNPRRHPEQGLFVDVQPGTVAVLDDLVIGQRGVESDGPLGDGRESAPPHGLVPQRVFSFEAPLYGEDRDVAGIDGWQATSFCSGPATSRASRNHELGPERRALAERRFAARRQWDAGRLAVAAAAQKLRAAEAERESLEARIAADTARYSGPVGNDHSDAIVSQMIRQAVGAEQDAAGAQVVARQLAAEQALAAAEALPASDGQRGAAQAAASQQFVAATAAVAAAQAARASLPAEYTPLSPQYPRRSTGRRSALARWVASSQNPLTARVAVNHIWLRHFHRALVETTHDFGRNGARPSHPELLDWLAVEFMEQGWSMKQLHRLIVTSDAYRRRSNLGAATHANQTVDRDNRLLWRHPPARMEAEVVRDSLLAVAGQLDLAVGGPELDQEQGLRVRRRSLYFAHHGEGKMQFLELFDAPNAGDCYRRTTSVRPQQALALVNSELVQRAGQELARALAAEQGPPPAGGAADGTFLTVVFEAVLGRPPSAAERAAGLRFLQRAVAAADGIPDAERHAQARANLAAALFSHHDFVTIH